MSIITGNTFPVRKHLQAMGARSVRDADGKFVGWEVPDEMAAAARKLVADATPPRAARANTGAVVMAPVPVAAPRPAPAPTSTPTVTVLGPDGPPDPWALLEDAAGLIHRVLSLAGDRPLGVEAAGWLRRYGQTQVARLNVYADAAAARTVPWEPVDVPARQDAPQDAQDAPGETPARQVTLRAAPAPAAPQEAPRTPQAARAVTVRAQTPQTPAKPSSSPVGALAWALGK